MSNVKALANFQFRTILGHYPTGVVVVTALDGAENPIGMTVGSFTSVSLDPPLIGFLPTRDSRSFGRLRGATSFCVNVLAADQEWLCRRFATSAKGPVDDRWAGVAWSASPSGAPVLDRVVAWIDCTLASITEAGDHFFVLGRVEELQVVRPVQPLLFFQGGYGRFVPLSRTGAHDDGEVIAGARMAERARPALEALAAAAGAECSVMTAADGDLIVAGTVAPPGCQARSQPGRRIPLLPPLGEAYVAWQAPEAREYWLSSAAGQDQETIASYRRRLHLTRERGWSMSLAADPGGGADAVQGDPHELLYEALHEYSWHHLTPARQRAIEQEIARVSRYYEPVELTGGQRYDVHSLVAPVYGAGGGVRMVLRLSRLPRQAAAADVERWLSLLLDTARGLSADADGAR